jgi:hypothetical protein
MSSSRLTGVRKSPLVRLLLIAIGVTVLILAALVVPPWLRATIPEREFRHAARAILLAAQPAYGAMLALVIGGMAVLGGMVIRARRRGDARPLLARMLLLCASGLLAIIVAEGAAAVWKVRTHRHPALPVLSTRSGGTERDEINIAVIGDSAALGLPFEKWLSTGHIVAWQLGEALSGRKFRLDVLAEPGVHLEWMHQKLAASRKRIDLLIIFSGHNEFTYRYSWSRSPEYYTDEIPFRPDRILKRLAERFSPLCCMIQEGIEAIGLGDLPPPEVTRELVDVPACTADEYAERKDDFRCRLESIVAHCERTDTLAVFLIPPSNDSGFEPNRSTLPATTPRSEREAFTSRFLTVRAGEESDPARATQSYRAILADQPDFAEAHFRLARLLERSGNRREAEPHFRAARDLDGLLMRCPGDFQEVYREVAARHPQALLIDGHAALAVASPGGILGDELFLDAMHPTVRGHALLAQAVLEGLRQRRAFGWPEGTPAVNVSPAACATHFQLDSETWKVACDWGATFYERTAHIRYDPSERLAWITRYREAKSAIARGSDPAQIGLPGIGVPQRTMQGGAFKAPVERMTR